jgi:hypothetical protein
VPTLVVIAGVIVVSVVLGVLKVRSPQAAWVGELIFNALACGLAGYLLVTAWLLWRRRILPGHWVGTSAAINLAMAGAALAFALPPLLTQRRLAAEWPAWQHALVWISVGLFVVAGMLGRWSAARTPRSPAPTSRPRIGNDS